VVLWLGCDFIESELALGRASHLEH
jgi:hypothetical protein